jgi:hypothetical protein
MTLLIIDGCEDRVTTAGTTARGRTGKGLQSFTNYAIPVANQSDTVTVGAAIRCSALTLTTLIGVTGPLSASCVVQVQTSGALSWSTGSTSRTTAAAFIPLNTWFYLELQCKVANSPNGFVWVRVNGADVPALTVSGIDTQAATGAIYDEVDLDSAGTTTNGVDDIYIMSGAGDSFLGDCVVETLYPTGNGTVNNWIGSDGNSTDNYLLVDETPANGTDYVGADPTGTQDLYNFGNLALSGDILAICHNVHAQKSDAGAKQLKIVSRGAIDTTSPAITLTTTFVGEPYQWVQMINPETGLAWTAAEVNALQAGVEVG